MTIDEIFSLIHEMKVDQARMSEQINNQQKLLEGVQNIAFAVRDLANAQNNTSEEVKRLRSDVDDIKSKPNKRWDSFVGTIISVIVTGVVMYAITKLYG